MGRNGAAKPKFPRAPDYPRGPRLCIAAGHGSHQVEINQSIIDRFQHRFQVRSVADRAVTFHCVGSYSTDCRPASWGRWGAGRLRPPRSGKPRAYTSRCTSRCAAEERGRPQPAIRALCSCQKRASPSVPPVRAVGRTYRSSGYSMRASRRRCEIACAIFLHAAAPLGEHQLRARALHVERRTARTGTLFSVRL